MATKTEEKKDPAELAPSEPSNVVVKVGQQVKNYLERKTLHLPSDYSPDNALKSAWLALQEVKDSNGKLALDVCSQASIVNALLDMVIQGLNPAKKQCYFIAYGTQLSCQRSYFGDMALAQRVCPGIQFYWGVVYHGDEFEYAIKHGVRVVIKHVQRLENVDLAKISGAYFGVLDSYGKDLGAEVMTMEQIKKSWSKSKTYGKFKGTPHEDFPDQMALRTVIRRRLKPIINASNDELLMQSVARQDLDAAEAEIDDEIAENANVGMIAAAALPGQATEEPNSESVPESVPPDYEPGADDANPTLGY